MKKWTKKEKGQIKTIFDLLESKIKDKEQFIDNLSNSKENEFIMLMPIIGQPLINIQLGTNIECFKLSLKITKEEVDLNGMLEKETE